jgi:FAD/FMN-containing dehydrogenase
LAYARSDCFAFVLLFSQDANALGESGMRAFTQALIDDVLALQGTFYLPYRPHYTLSQLQAAYPQLNAFLAIKRQVDPHNLFTNEWYDTYLKDLNGDKKK